MRCLRTTTLILLVSTLTACTIHVESSPSSFAADAGAWEADGAPPDWVDPSDDPDGLGGGAEPSAAEPGDPDGAFGGGAGAPPGVAGGGTIDDPCRGEPPRGAIVGTEGRDRLRGGPGDDVIFGLGGDDVIEGGAGNDIICAGGGEDRIEGGAGADYIDAGFGRDFVDGGYGNDTIHGRNGGDILRGGPGNDALFGDVLDDHLYGDGGHDLLVGGHGTDSLHGGSGNDWLRGDTGHDTFIGGRGVDTVSFMTAMPPGQPRNEGAPVEGDGVIVDLSVQPTSEGETWDGLASGDGFREMLRGVERVLGSAFDDTLVAGSGTRALLGAEGDDVLYGPGDRVGGGGYDRCDGADCEPGEAITRAPTAYVLVDGRPRDPGLVVLGADGAVDDALHVDMIAAARVRITATNGASVGAGPGCTATGASIVECTVPRTLRYLVVATGDGNDTVQIGSGFPRDMTAHVDGGRGDDLLTGGDGEDVLFGGREGVDVLSGNGGDDALLSESWSSHATMRGEEYPDGTDVLDGGPGNDQLVSDYPCGGHIFDGGPGIDIAGFARSADLPIHAHLGQGAERGRAYVPSRCDNALGTRLAGDLEILEGADGNDVLTGNDGPNTIWGWGGNDVIHGGGGDDVIEGHLGDDVLYGDPGRDVLRGGGGFDHLHAADGATDRELSCGGSGNVASKDPSDPPPDRC